MASVAIDRKTGLRRLMFFVAEKRITIHLGPSYRVRDFSKGWQTRERKVNMIFCGHVQALVTAQERQGPLPGDTAAWLKDQDKGLLDKLGALGLTQERRKGPVALGDFINEYITKRTLPAGRETTGNIPEGFLKPKTVLVLKLVRDRLIGYFRTGRDMTTITTGDAVDCRLSWIKKGLAENTVRKSCSIAKQFFADAIRRKIISENPFKSKVLPCAVRGNDDRFHFVTREEIQRLIDGCAPDNVEWRLLIALARYGGLRTPSESLALRWDGVNFQEGRIKVYSPKTEHHEGKEYRWIPLYPELEPYLTAAHAQAKDGAVYVITQYRDDAANLRTQLGRIADRAGISLWPKPWANMRISRQTELSEDFPSHVVTQWMGNSQQVADKHYLKTTDEHFDRANGKTAQNAAQIPPDTGRYEGKATDTPKTTIAELSANTGDYHNIRYPDKRYPPSPTGLEPVTFGFGGQRSIQLSYEDIISNPYIYATIVPASSPAAEIFEIRNGTGFDEMNRMSFAGNRLRQL
jgi:integrase